MTVVLLAAASVVLCPRAADAQTEILEAAFGFQAAILQRIFSELEAAPRERQRLHLWMADLLLTPGQGPMGAAGIEQAVADGALGVLQRLERGPDGDIAALAAALRVRVETDLDLDGAAAATTAGRSAPVEFEADRWVAMQAEANVEYRLDASACRVVRAVALGADRLRGVAGGTVFGSSFTFVSDRDELMYLRVRTLLCEGRAPIRLSARAPAVPLRASAPRDRPEVVSADGRYQGTLDAERWFRVEVRGGRLYVITAVPEDSRSLDPHLTLFSGDGAVEITSDDDSGGDLASKIEYMALEDTTLLLRAHPLDGGGVFDLTMTSSSPLDLAQSIDAGDTRPGHLTPGGEQWWRIDASARQTYVFETKPDDGLDTMMTLYQASGHEIGRDDDGGEGLGSKLEWTGASDATLLLRVHEYTPDAGGSYELAVTTGVLPEIRPVALSQAYDVTIDRNREHWWSVEVMAGIRYVFSASPAPGSNLDTFITLYQADRVTEIANDDDGGDGLGSRLEHTSEDTRILLVKVGALSESTGPYRFEVSPAEAR